ncbi:cellulose binding domain-containing protein, partial [Streptomyces sp. SID5643]|uniref:cellulose binding domain-containing protein n=1 Tax=Streptomyces sp. SID5643 TaxID=2690307 RepID=UPI0013FBFFAA
QKVTNGWNAKISQSGAAVTAANESYNGTLATGGSVGFGFQGTYSGSNAIPATFTLDGVTCNVDGGGGPTDPPDPTDPPTGTRVDNPYSGAKVYVNPEWSAKAAAEPGGSRIANQPTGVWLDRIAAIEGVRDGMGLRDHLDEALRQKGSG